MKSPQSILPGMMTPGDSIRSSDSNCEGPCGEDNVVKKNLFEDSHSNSLSILATQTKWVTE